MKERIVRFIGESVLVKRLSISLSRSERHFVLLLCTFIKDMCDKDNEIRPIGQTCSRFFLPVAPAPGNDRGGTFSKRGPTS